MHLSILMTNTDESDFAQLHAKDGEKFPAMMHEVRPDWTFEVFSVKDDIFPATLDGFDGVMITGSPASTLGDAAWIERLLDLIREIHAQELPMFGACFGHQAIALALGGEIGRNPDGWVHGLTHNTVVADQDWTRALPRDLKLYGSHVEYVAALPDAAQVLFQALNGAVTGYAIGHTVYTTQHHPEMTDGFIAALTEELADDMGPEVASRARASLAEQADKTVFANSIARFFEHARSD
ncbi:MAG: type 1 glutamine amidotransferase [Rhodobacteraceae bacterium]|nr:type 1 glutamine amidotransferase [Paracoccaceae bacterium]